MDTGIISEVIAVSHIHFSVVDLLVRIDIWFNYEYSYIRISNIRFHRFGQQVVDVFT